jgi:hypothetical protein
MDILVNMRRFFRVTTIGLTAVILLIGSFFVFNNYLYQEKQSDGVAPVQYQATLEGEYVCLQHVERRGTECEPGIRTAGGEHYAVDFFLFSESVPEFEVGQKFTANGTVTTIEALNTDKWQQAQVAGLFSVTDSVARLDGGEKVTVCTAEVKLCPDGSYVGRTGPSCAFASCPTDTGIPAKISTVLGSEVTSVGLTVSPQEIISDSRCPSDVECVWAGTVEVRTTFATPTAHGEQVLTLGKPQIFGEYTITLTEVFPIKTAEAISQSDYTFTFLINQ